jgi:DNA-binding PadR family transcriptional regulator
MPVMGGAPNFRALLILLSLADGDRHGYAIRKDVAARSGGDVTLGSSTLYRLLGELLDDGLIEDSEIRPAPQYDDERRRYFRLTAAGRRALTVEFRRLERVLQAMKPALSRGR